MQAATGTSGRFDSLAALRSTRQGAWSAAWLCALFALVCVLQVFQPPFYVWTVLMLLACQSPYSTIMFLAATQVIPMSAFPGFT